jgi:ankyrin repeat protein
MSLELALSVPLPGSDEVDERLLTRENSIDTVKRLHRAEREARDAAEREAARLSEELQQLQDRLTAISSQMTDDSLARTRTAMERINCPICMDTMVDAATLSCGHSGCLGCLQANLARSSRCPTCRAPHYGGVNVNVTLREHIDRLFKGSTERVEQITESRLSQAEQLRSARQFSAARDAFRRAAGGAPASQRDSILVQIESLPTHADGTVAAQIASDATRRLVVGTDSSAPPEIRDWKFHFTTGVIKGEVYNYPGREDGSPISTSQVARAQGHVIFTHSGSRYQLAEPARWFKREMHLRGHWDEDSPLETILQLSQVTRQGLMAIDRDSDDVDEDSDSDSDSDGGSDDNAINRLVRAADDGDAAAVYALLSTSDFDCNALDEDGTTALVQAAAHDHEDVVALLLRHPGIDVDRARDDGVTPLINAAAEGNTDAVDRLLAAGARIDCADDDGDTALFVAANNGYAPVVRSICKKIVETGQLECLNQPSGRNRKVTPLMGATDVDCAQALVDAGASLEAVNSFGETVLMTAVLVASCDVISALISAGARLDARTCFYGETALHLAVARGDSQQVELLISSGAEVNAADDYGCTPLSHAAKAGRLDLVSCLLSKRADPNTADLRQESPLLVARRAGHGHIVSALLAAGPDSES